MLNHTLNLLGSASLNLNQFKLSIFEYYGNKNEMYFITQDVLVVDRYKISDSVISDPGLQGWHKDLKQD